MERQASLVILAPNHHRVGLPLALTQHNRCHLVALPLSQQPVHTSLTQPRLVVLFLLEPLYAGLRLALAPCQIHSLLMFLLSQQHSQQHNLQHRCQRSDLAPHWHRSSALLHCHILALANRFLCHRRLLQSMTPNLLHHNHHQPPLTAQPPSLLHHMHPLALAPDFLHQRQALAPNLLHHRRLFPFVPQFLHHRQALAPNLLHHRHLLPLVPQFLH